MNLSETFTEKWLLQAKLNGYQLILLGYAIIGINKSIENIAKLCVNIALPVFAQHGVVAKLMASHVS